MDAPDRVLVRRNRPKYAARVAKAAWEKDGKPERDPYDPTTVGRRDYEFAADQVLGILPELGLEVVRRESPAIDELV